MEGEQKGHPFVFFILSLALSCIYHDCDTSPLFKCSHLPRLPVNSVDVVGEGGGGRGATRIAHSYTT